MRRGDGLFTTKDGTLVAVSGIGFAAAAAAATALVDAGAVALVSWGVAGGLDPALRAGTICLPGEVVSRDGTTFMTDHHWRELIAAAIASRHTLVAGKLLTSNLAIDDDVGKANAFRDTGAVAVDMESAAVASIAAARGLPFVAVRVIADTAVDALPRAVIEATRLGSVRIARLLLETVRRPGDVAGLIRLAQRYRTARRVLAAVAHTGVLAPFAMASSSPTRVA